MPLLPRRAASAAAPQIYRCCGRADDFRTTIALQTNAFKAIEPDNIEGSGEAGADFLGSAGGVEIGADLVAAIDQALRDAVVHPRQADLDRKVLACPDRVVLFQS
ncbi:hypothetical protein [Paracoccus rhizosphaerae]|uniref:Uncharacterized protein n=1 Tax=Paracoccus rhizosphaerae TaxID=1133347 RepID=A0ABV6CFQ2_9RHOB|nr:hypothetical protein [Paracoccus rhizosphaerae]